MIPDNSTNYLYLADSLPIKHPKFYTRFEKVLQNCNIDFKLLPHTKDIWAVDYMPIQISKDKFVQFTYSPDYLNEYRDTISDVDKICKAIGLTTHKSSLIVDGGNISRTTDKVIMCDKVFHENKKIPEKELINQLTTLFADAQWLNTPLLIMGGGSNMLFTKDFDGLVIRMEIPGINHHVHGKHVSLMAGAGVVWNDLVNYCVTHGFAGVENLSLIPGTVGAAPIQNIGAYGVELKDVFDSCEVFDTQTQQLSTFTHADCQFGYRESIFKQHQGRYIVTHVKFNLSLNPQLNTRYGAIEHELQARGINQPSIADVASTVAHIRVSKLPDPSTIGNAGSFFKNPVIANTDFEPLLQKFPNMVHYPAAPGFTKLAAGWLIEQCGWKGKTIGQAGTWHNQALVLVNMGNATGEEIYALSSQIIYSVYSKFGVQLHREVNII